MHYLPFVDFERGYFLDIKCFFPNKRLIGHKILSGPCNLKCYYCHRKDFLNDNQPLVPIEEILNKLEKREYYNTIVVTGGEITLFHKAASAIMRRLKSKGITTLFSTNGFFPKRVEKMLEFADVVKIDIKGTKSQYIDICGADIYAETLKSISIASKKRCVEVKCILHHYTKENHIEKILNDLYKYTGMPSNLAIEFQPVKDFLNIGVKEPNVEKLMNICAFLQPLPNIALFKHYGEKERIYKLEDGNWQVYFEKEIPLRFNWKNNDNSQ